MATYEQMLMAVIMDPPDPKEPQPPANRRETIFGTVIGFLVWHLDKISLDHQLIVYTDSGLDRCHLSSMGPRQGRSRAGVG